jgi:hypothetical protein
MKAYKIEEMKLLLAKRKIKKIEITKKITLECKSLYSTESFQLIPYMYPINIKKKGIKKKVVSEAIQV